MERSSSPGTESHLPLVALVSAGVVPVPPSEWPARCRRIDTLWDEINDRLSECAFIGRIRRNQVLADEVTAALTRLRSLVVAVMPVLPSDQDLRIVE